MALFAALILAGATVSAAAFAQAYPAGWRGDVTGARELDKCRNYSDTRELFLNAVEGYLDPWVYTSAEISVMTVAAFEALVKRRWRAAGVDLDDPDLFQDPSIYSVELDSRFETFDCNAWSEGKDWDIIVVEIKKASSQEAGEAGKGLNRDAEPLQGNVTQRDEETPETPNDDGQSDEGARAEVQALVDEVLRGSGDSSDSNAGGQAGEELSPELRAFLDDVARGGDGTQTSPAGDGQTEEEQRAEVQAMLDEISRDTGGGAETASGGGQTEEAQRAEVQAMLDEISRDTDATEEALAEGDKSPADSSLVAQGAGGAAPQATDSTAERPKAAGASGDGAGDRLVIETKAPPRDAARDVGLAPGARSDTPNQAARRADMAVANRGTGKPSRGPPTDTARVDPRLVGTWTLIGAPGFDWRWEIRPDGTYTLRNAGQTIHAGTVTFIAGTWTLRSPRWQDGGRYTLEGEHQATIIGTLGPGTWVRGDR